MNDEFKFKDGKGNAHDRTLVRIINYMQIAGGIFTLCGAIVGMWWGTIQIVRCFDSMRGQINILQQQVSALQGMVVNSPIHRKRDRENKD